MNNHNKYADQCLVMCISGFGSLVSRFLITNMNTLGGTLTVIWGQGMVELVLRQTITNRHRFIYRYILRREADERFKTESYRRYRARVVLSDMPVNIFAEHYCVDV